METSRYPRVPMVFRHGRGECGVVSLVHTCLNVKHKHVFERAAHWPRLPVRCVPKQSSTKQSKSMHRIVSVSLTSNTIKTRELQAEESNNTLNTHTHTHTHTHRMHQVNRMHQVSLSKTQTAVHPVLLYVCIAKRVQYRLIIKRGLLGI